MAFESLTDERIEQLLRMQVCHIHQATERYLQARLKPEGFAQATDTYKTCDGALHRLVSDCNIEGLETQADHPELFR